MTAEHIPTDNISIEAVSENAILLTWPEIICPRQHQQIIHCQKQIHIQLAEVIFETVPAYHSLMVYYHFDKVSLPALIAELNEIIKRILDTTRSQLSSDMIVIPVYYGEDAGWDLSEVAKRCQLSINDVIQYHSQATYHAYALGFTPGFCYLGSVNPKLVLPRKDKPRLNIPKGAVAIAEQQSAVYPNNSPGGWHILGQTPMPMYTINNQNQQSQFQATISVGQQVTFKPITFEEFIALGGIVELEHQLAVNKR